MIGKAQPAWTEPLHRYERAEYANVVEAVDRVLAAENIRFAHSVRRYLYAPAPPHPEARALDVGCGVGQGCLVLQRLGWRRLVGIDATDSADADVRRAGIRFQTCAAEEYQPFAPFDLVACCDVIEHVKRPEELLRQMVQWVAPGGILFVTVPLEGDISRNPYHLHAWNKAGIMLMLAQSWRVVREGMLGVADYWAWVAPKPRLTWWEVAGGLGTNDA